MAVSHKNKELMDRYVKPLSEAHPTPRDLQQSKELEEVRLSTANSVQLRDGMKSVTTCVALHVFDKRDSALRRKRLVPAIRLLRPTGT